MEDLLKEGFVRLRVDGEMIDLAEQVPDLKRYKQHDIEIVVDRIVIKEPKTSIRSRVADSLEQALKRGKGMAVADVFALGDSPVHELRFNSPYGACPDCHGLGTRAEFDPLLITPDRSLSIAQGTLRPYVPKTGAEKLYPYMRALFEGVCVKLGFTLDTPLAELSKEQFNRLMNGVKGKFTVEHRTKWGRSRKFDADFKGVILLLEQRLTETSSDWTREEFEQYHLWHRVKTCRATYFEDQALLARIP